MGQSAPTGPQHYNEEELLAQLAEFDPDFQYHDYVDGNCTLQEVISIRQCFLDLRSDYENQAGDVILCGNVCEQSQSASADPPETVSARKLRSIPFLTNEEIARVSMPGSQQQNDMIVIQASEHNVDLPFDQNNEGEDQD